MGVYLGPGGQVDLGSVSTGVPPPNFGAQAAAETAGQKSAGWFSEFWAYYHASRAHGIGVVWSTIISGAQDLIAVIIKFYSLFTGQGTPGFYNLASAVVSDLVGVEFDINQGGFGSGGATNRQGNIALGQGFLSILTSLIAPQLPLTPAGGLSAAQGFLGFLMSFAIRQGNISVISSLIPEEYRFGEGVKEYGENLAKALGLGRMARLAFTPLINVLIADPLKWWLNSTYTPTLMNEAQLVRSQLRGLTLTPDAATQLSWLGWSQDNIAALQADTYQRPPVGDLYLLNRYGEIADADLTTHVVNLGTDQVTAALMIEAEKLKQFETAVAAEFAWYKQLATARIIDPPTFRQMATELGIDATTVEQASHFITFKAEKPSKRVTLAQMQAAYVSGLADLSEFETYLVNEDYTVSDAQLLVMLELQKQTDHASQVAVARYKYNKAVASATAKGLPIPPPPAILT